MDYSYYKEVQAERAIQGNFSSGQINFKFNLNGTNNSWVPSKSYMKIKLKISKGDDSRLDKEYGIAPNLNICDNIFQQIDMRINDKIVSEWNDYIPQCATLKMRLNKSKNRREALLSSCNYSQIYITERINDVSNNGSEQPYRYAEEMVGQLTRAQTFGGAQIDEGADTLALGANDGILTWVDGAGGDLDLRNASNLNVGDVIKLTNPAEFTGLYIIQSINQLTITVSPPPSVAGVAANIANNAAFNIRKVIDGKYLRKQGANDLDLIWTPPIGFWDINEELCGNFKLELTPHAEGIWQKLAVEGLSDRQALGSNEAADVNKFKVEIREILLYLWLNVKSSPMNGQKNIRISDIKCNAQTLTTNSLTSKVFNIDKRNHSVTLAFQDSAVGDDITLSRSKFKISNEEEQNLVRYYINMNHLTLPNPIPSLEVNYSGGINNIIQRYYESLNYSYNDDRYESHESVKEWLDCGPYFHYKWREKGDSSGQCEVYSNFSSAFTRNPQMLLFDHYYRNIALDIRNGEVIDVQCS